MGDNAVGHLDQDAAAPMTALAGSFDNLLLSHLKLQNER
jgi:hypothetical protein